MRWFVEISPLGTKGGEDALLCVEAPQWQPALQKARAIRGDNGALSNFSIELLEDGYRAIDPTTRLRYIVRRAPDDAGLTNGATSVAPPRVSEAPAPSEASGDLKKRPPAPTVGFSSQGTAIVKPPEATPEPPADLKKRPPAPTMAFSSTGSAHVEPVEAAPPEPPRATPAAVADKAAADKAAAQKAAAEKAAAEKAAAEKAAADKAAAEKAAADKAAAEKAATDKAAADKAAADKAATQKAPSASEHDLVPSFVGIGSREDNPTEASPLTYREYVYAVAAGTSEDDAKRLIFERFEHVRSTLDPTRSGKLINLAVFDHIFQGRPQRRPLVTLTWKDWKGDAPELHFPLREGESQAPRSSAAPASMPPAAAKASVAASTASTASAASTATRPAPAPVSPTLESGKAPDAPTPAEPAPAPAKTADKAPAPATAKAADKAPAQPAAAAKPADKAPSSASAARVAPASAKGGKPAGPSSAPRSDAPRKRLSGEDLLAELFEAFGDLHFARDSLEGAEFVLNLTLEKLPSELGLISLFDMNKREFVVVRQSGGPHRALCARQPERAALAFSAMRKRHALVISDPAEAEKAMDDRFRAIGVQIKSLVCAPVELSGRYLGLLELVNPIDGKAFNEADGNALTYIGQQFAEFVAARGVIVDPAQIRGEDEKPVSSVSRSQPAPSKKGR